MRDANLRNIIVERNTSCWRDLCNNPSENTIRSLTSSFIYDLKYMASPKTLPFILGETDFLDKLIEGLSVFHFKDCEKCPKQMQAFDNSTTLTIARIEMIFAISKYIEKYFA